MHIMARVHAGGYAVGRRVGVDMKQEVGMGKKDGKDKGGLRCPHCADSKYPCVTMEKQMHKGSGITAQTRRDKKA